MRFSLFKKMSDSKSAKTHDTGEAAAFIPKPGDKAKPSRHWPELGRVRREMLGIKNQSSGYYTLTVPSSMRTKTAHAVPSSQARSRRGISYNWFLVRRYPVA